MGQEAAPRSQGNVTARPETAHTGTPRPGRVSSTGPGWVASPLAILMATARLTGIVPLLQIGCCTDGMVLGTLSGTYAFNFVFSDVRPSPTCLRACAAARRPHLTRVEPAQIVKITSLGVTSQLANGSMSRVELPKVLPPLRSIAALSGSGVQALA